MKGLDPKIGPVALKIKKKKKKFQCHPFLFFVFGFTILSRPFNLQRNGSAAVTGDPLGLSYVSPEVKTEPINIIRKGIILLFMFFYTIFGVP